MSSLKNMDPQKRREMCSKAGKLAHQMGVAYEFSPEAAKHAGRLGGAALREKYGKEYFSELGKRGGLAASADRKHMAEIGRKGGLAVSADKKHMAEIGSKGGQQKKK